MTIPTPAFTSSDVATECGLSTPWASDAAGLLAVLADGALPYTSADLAGRSSADYVPAALAWNDIYSAGGTGGYNAGSTNDQTVTGINATITILVELTGMYCNGSADNAFNGDWSFWAVANGVSTSAISYGGFGGTSTSFTFTVANNQVVSFVSQLLVSDQLDGAASGQGGAATVTIKNQSSGNTVLDTFAVYLSASNP